MHNEGALALAKHVSPTLRYLDVSMNHIGQAGIDALTRANIPVLDVRGNEESNAKTKAHQHVSNNSHVQEECTQKTNL